MVSLSCFCQEPGDWFLRTCSSGFLQTSSSSKPATLSGESVYKWVWYKAKVLTSVASLRLSQWLWLLQEQGNSQPVLFCSQPNTAALTVCSLMTIILVVTYCLYLDISKYVVPSLFPFQLGSRGSLRWGFPPRNRLASPSWRWLNNCSTALSSSFT